MKGISDFIKWYCYITVSILAVCAVITLLFSDKMIPTVVLCQILLSGFLTTLTTVFIGLRETSTKRGAVLKFIIHYIVLCIIMVVCGGWFGWTGLNVHGVLLMMGAVAAVYGLTCGIDWVINLQQANEINQKLKEMYEDEK